MKRIYISPSVDIVYTDISQMIALSGPDEGIGEGGNAGEHELPEPDVKEFSTDDIWETELQ